MLTNPCRQKQWATVYYNEYAHQQTKVDGTNGQQFIMMNINVNKSM